MSILKQKSIGVDISDHTIEVVEVEKSGGKIEILSKARKKIDKGLVENGRIVNEEKLREVFQKTLKEAKPNPIKGNDVVFGLPESQTYTHSFKTENKGKKELENMIEMEAQKNIPIENENLTFFYKILRIDKSSEKKEIAEILIIAANKNTIKEWKKFFDSLKIDIEFFETESSAIFRGLYSKKAEKPICIIDLGAETTNVSIFDKLGLHSAFAINNAGNDITNEIARAVSKDIAEAEKEKIANGLNSKDKNVVSAIQKNLDKIIKEINEATAYFEKNYGEKIFEIVLVGGTSQLKGLDKYFKEKIKIPIKKGSPILINKISLEYLGATGLAMKGFGKKWFREEKTFDVKSIIGTKEKKVEEKGVEENSEEGNREEQNLSSIEKIDASQRPDKKKVRQQKIILTSIIIAGVIIVGAVYFIKYSDKYKMTSSQNIIPSFDINQTISVSIPVATKSDEYTPGRIRGRVIENTVQSAESFSKAIVISEAQIQNSLAEGEINWKEPLNYKEQKEVYPVTFQWLIFNEAEADKLFFNKVGKINENGVEYIIDNINKNKLEKTEYDYIYNMVADVDISSNEIFQVKTTNNEN